MTVSEMKNRMTAREYAEWMALESIERQENLESGLAERAVEGLARIKANRGRK